jgi:hypothetical protein
MKMKKTLQTFRYLTNRFSMGMVIGFLVILGTVAVTDWAFFLTSQYSMVNQDLSLTVPFEFVTGIFALLIGLVLFVADFKVALANGISRRTFLIANLPAAGIAAAAFSFFDLIVVELHGLFWPINSFSAILFPVTDRSELLIVQFTLQFALYFLLIMTGRFIILAYYRSSPLVKWAISLAPFILFGLVQVADARSGGTISRAISDYLHWSLNFPRAVISMLFYSAVLYGLIYLLIRRAPLKD